MNYTFNLIGIERFYRKCPESFDIIEKGINTLLFYDGSIATDVLLNTFIKNGLIDDCGTVVRPFENSKMVYGYSPEDYSMVEIDLNHLNDFLKLASAERNDIHPKIIRLCMEVFTTVDPKANGYDIAKNTLITYKFLKVSQSGNKGADTTTNKKDKDIN